MTGDPGNAPGFHTYVDAPPPVSVVEFPEQIVVDDADAVTVGVVLTVTVTFAVDEHPVVVPVTVYVVVAAGETVTVVPANAPGFHVYEAAPLPVSVVELPEQIVGLAAVAVTVGVGFTVIATCAVEEHPPVVPVTV